MLAWILRDNYRSGKARHTGITGKTYRSLAKEKGACSSAGVTRGVIEPLALVVYQGLGRLSPSGFSNLRQPCSLTLRLCCFLREPTVHVCPIGRRFRPRLFIREGLHAFKINSEEGNRGGCKVPAFPSRGTADEPFVQGEELGIGVRTGVHGVEASCSGGSV